MIKLAINREDVGDWLICDGRMLEAADFPELSAMMGQRFGGSGAQFGIPDLRGDQANYFLKARSAPQDANYVASVSQMVLWVGEQVPDKWLPCDGRMVQAADYPLLTKVVAASQRNTPEAYHLPMVPPLSGVPYIICMDGLDPLADAAPNDDDY